MKNLIQSIIILIAVHMSATGAQEVIYARVGGTVTLDPPAEFNPNKHYLYWQLEERTLAWSNSLGGKSLEEPWKNVISWSGYSLTIKNIQQEHFRTIGCKLDLNSAKDTRTYKIVKLDVTVNPTSLLLPGESLSLTCNTEDLQSPHKKPEMYWLDPQGRRVNNNPGTLKVKATGQHNGEWTCVVKSAKESRHKISVTVVDLSPAPLRPQYIATSSPLNIPCSIHSRISWEQIKAKGIKAVEWHFFPNSGSPQKLFFLSPTDPVTWKEDHNRGLTASRDPKKGDLTLTRNQAKEEDRGDYVCILKFNNSITLNRTVHVKVLKIVSSPGTELISGQRVNLSCSLGQPLPSDLQVKWVPPEQSSLQFLKSDHQPPHLTIPEVSTRHDGKWRCELWQNGTRLTWAVTTLKIEFRLSAWMLAIICSVIAIVILLIIISIICRLRKRKMRHPRHRLCQCKNPKPKGFYRT